MTVERSTVTRPPWRSAVARTMASPSPDPAGRRTGPRQKRSKASRSPGPRPGPASRTASSPPPPATPRDAPRRRAARGSRRCRAGCRASGQRVGLAADVRGVSASTRTPARPATASATIASSRTGCRAPRPGDSRSRASRSSTSRAGAPCRLEVGEHLGVDTVARDELDVPRGGQRGAQLVAGVGQQPAFAQARGGERGEHRVQRARQVGDLVVGEGLGQAPGGVLGARDLGRGGEMRAAAGSATRESAPPRRRRPRRQQPESSSSRPRRCFGPLDVGRCSRRRARRRRPRAPRRGQRRGVEADRSPSSRTSAKPPRPWRGASGRARCRAGAWRPA